MEESHKLLIEILSRISSLETKNEHLNKSFDNLSIRLEEIEESHQKTLGAIQFATAITTVATVFLVTFANLWVDQKIVEYHRNETPQQEIKKHKQEF